jgi:dTDP-4-amino-4,6-dideoxygalactose transaminase
VAIERFPEQLKQRNEAANYLEEALSEVPGVRLLRRDPRHTSRTIYQYGFAIDPQVFKNTHEVVCAALDAEGIPADTGYQPMNHYDLFQPGLSKLPVPSMYPERFDYTNIQLPAAERAAEQESVWLDEAVFRDGQRGVDDFVSALKKVLENGEELSREAAKLRA